MFFRFNNPFDQFKQNNYWILMKNWKLISSNLKLAINKALTLSESLEKIWEDGDLKKRQKLQNLVFRYGLGYDKSNDRVRTPKVNAIFGSIPILSKEISNIKKGEPIPVNQFSDLVTQGGFEPPTLRAEIWYSIQLNYWAFFMIIWIEQY